jgi:two-component system chemotaxis response regulator CheB
MKYRAIVIGTSSGGMKAIKFLSSALPAVFGIPIIMVLHIGARSGNEWINFFNAECKFKLKEADEKEKIAPGNIYVAPANYHLLIEKDETLSLTIDEKVNYARPSIDILFESAALAYGNRLIGIVLTGANSDGAVGIKKIKEYGGLTIVQDPETAEAKCMPESSISSIVPDHILSLEGIVNLLIEISES